MMDAYEAHEHRRRAIAEVRAMFPADISTGAVLLLRQATAAAFDIAEREAVADRERIAAALDLLVTLGGNDGRHHAAWVRDQAVRILAGERYDEIRAEACAGDDGPDTHEWDEGIAP